MSDTTKSGKRSLLNIKNCPKDIDGVIVLKKFQLLSNLEWK